MQIVKLTNEELLANTSLLGKVTKLWLAEKHIERQLDLLKGALAVPATWFVAHTEKEAYAVMKVGNLPYSGSYPGKWLSLIFSRGFDNDLQCLNTEEFKQCLTTEDFRTEQQCLTTEDFRTEQQCLTTEDFRTEQQCLTTEDFRTEQQCLTTEDFRTEQQCLTTEDFRTLEQCLTTESFENAHPGVQVARAVTAYLRDQGIHELYVTQIDRPSLRKSWKQETNMFNVAGLHIDWDQYIVAIIPANTVPEQQWLAGFVGNNPRLSDVIVRKFVLKNALRNEFSSVKEFFQTA